MKSARTCTEPESGVRTKPSHAPTTDAAGGEALYQQLARQLAEQILSGEFAAGGQLPHERDLAVQCGRSRCTVRAALKILEAQGLIHRVKGKGTFVTHRHGGSRWFSTASTILLVQIQGATGSYASGNSYYGLIHAGVRRMARALGLSVKQRAVRGYVQVPLTEYNPPKPSEVGGVILSGTFDEQYIRMYESEGVPVVVTDYWVQDSLADCVAVDVENEAYTTIEHLADRGHTSLGFLAAGRRQSNSSLRTFDPDISRLLGFLRQGAPRRGIQIRDEWIVLASVSGMMEGAARQLLGLETRPTAVLCFNDMAIESMLKILPNASIRCPEDVSIISRGTDVIADRRITCFASDPEMIGRQAVRLLVERMQGDRKQVAKMVLSSRLVLGTTTGPVPRLAEKALSHTVQSKS